MNNNKYEKETACQIRKGQTQSIKQVRELEGVQNTIQNPKTEI